MKRVRRTVLSLAVAGAAAVAGMTALTPMAAHADPIYCPDHQSPYHVDDGTWVCQNQHGNNTGAGWHQGTDDKI